MSDKFDEFQHDLKLLCLKHNVQLFITVNGDLEVSELPEGEEPLNILMVKSDG